MIDERAPTTAGIPVGDIMEVMAATMQQERGRINGLSSFSGDGTYGDRMAQACTDAAYAVMGSGTGDAGEDLQLAGQVLDDALSPVIRGTGSLGQGLLLAGEQFYGQQGLSLRDLDGLLTALLQGVQQTTEAQYGMGTQLDVLVPAVTAYHNAVQGGLSFEQATQGLLGAAMAGVRSTANMPQPYNLHPKGKPASGPGQPDPGAAAAQTFLTGLVKGLLGDKVPPTPAGQNASNFLMNLLQQGIDLGGGVVQPPRANDVESLLGNTARAGRYTEPLADTPPGYGKGTDIGGARS